jgi:hypothetical protein
MVLDGIEGFPSTQENVTNSNEDVIKEKSQLAMLLLRAI